MSNEWIGRIVEERGAEARRGGELEIAEALALVGEAVGIGWVDADDLVEIAGEIEGGIVAVRDELGVEPRGPRVRVWLHDREVECDQRRLVWVLREIGRRGERRLRGDRALLIVSIDGAWQARVEAGGEATIGRGAGCEIVVAELLIARRQATFAARDGGWVVRDAGSTGGTWIDDEIVRGDVMLEDGMRLRLGGVRVIVRQGES